MPDAWLASVPGVREHEPLAPHSWYGIGGRARYFLESGDADVLSDLIPRLKRDAIPYRAIGAATNTLFVGDELDGLTIKLGNARLTVAESVIAGAGALMPRLAAETARAGRAGLEFGAGVPGTVGGSVFGNAGAFGGEVKDAVLSVEVIDDAGRRRVLGAGARLLEVQKHRRDTQPIEQRSLGSTFKNPPGDSAGRLIDASGLKGLRIGGAQISPKHANFIVNVDGATADDVLALMAEMRGRVLQRFGIELEPEVRIIGRTPPA
ncbi:MAG: FAD-binding protein [Chloroflexi bacterium]|nr:MAG: FAD-binding protein [Chloroflexota bacterium]